MSERARKFLRAAPLGCGLFASNMAMALDNVVDPFGYSVKYLAQPVGSINAPMTADGAFNVNASSLPKWRAALARVRSGAGRAKILVEGDSTSMGGGAGTTGGGYNLTGAYAFGWPQQLAGILSKSVSVNTNCFLGDQNVGSALYQSYDPRVTTLGANWSAAAVPTLGGNTWVYTTGAVNNFSFTPSGSIDTVTMFYTSGGGGTVAVNVDGGATLGTIGGGGSISTYSVTAGAHVVNIVPSNNGLFYLLGEFHYLSTTPAVDICQGAWFGANAASFSNGTLVASTSALVAPDLTIINLTINDANSGTNLTAYQASIQTLINTAKLTGDVILVAGPPSNSVAATNGTMAQYAAINQQLAITNNVPYLSILQRWTSYAVTNPIFPYFDSIHPGKLGNNDEAAAVSELLLHP